MKRRPSFRQIDFEPALKNRTSSLYKFTASFVLITFLTTQVSWGQEISVSSPSGLQPTKNIESEDTSSFLTPAPSKNTISDTVNFLQENSPLGKVENDNSQNYEYERYYFDEALENLRPEYASAVIVKGLTAENLKELVEQPFETGILVLHGEIVLFTSGSEDEIGVLPAARELISKASFISHTHPSQYSKEGPSGQDLNEAVVAPNQEYVLTGKGVYAYNQEGILNDGKPYTYEWYLEKLKEAIEITPSPLPSPQMGRGLGEGQGQVEARKELNLFIAEQDRYNSATEEEKETFRRGGTLSNTAGLTSTSVTTLSGSPLPYLSAGSSVGTTLSYNATTALFQLGYSVPNATDFSGLRISFDNETTPAVETQNVSVLANLTFGLKGPNTTVELRITDINGVEDTFTLTNIISTGERFWRVPVASISNTLDKTKIKSLQFIVSQTNTTATTRTGTLYVRAKGLNTAAPTQPVITSAVPAATNQTTLTLTGTKEANTAILINSVQVVPRDSATTWTATVNLAVEGNNTFSITTKNSIGKVSTAKSITVRKDTVLPTGSININSGAVYTAAASVTLNLSAADTGGSGIDKMSFSSENVNWTALEAYAVTKSFMLPSGDGNKTVYVRYYDKAGNIKTASKSIILDTVAPSGTIQVNGGVQAIKQTSVTLNLSATDAGSGLDKMSFSSNNVTYTTAEVYAATKAWTFAAGDGNKTVYVKFLDKSGKWSTPVSVTVLLDTVIPTGSININSAATYTNSTEVTLNLSAADAASGIDKMSFSTDSVTWTNAEAYATSKTFALPSGDGNKTVYVKYYDKAGNVSSVYSKSIILDTVTPAGTIQINSDATYATNPDVTLALTASDATSGPDQMRFSTDGGSTWSTWETIAATKSLTLASGDGLKEVQYQLRDKAGLVSTFNDTLLLDTTVPAGTVKINNGTEYTNNGIMSFDLNFTDAGSGVAQVRYRRGSHEDWSAWIAYTSSIVVDNWGADGTRWAGVQVMDGAGNIAEFFDSIILDTKKPTGAVAINNGADYTNNGIMTFNLNFQDDVSGVAEMRYRRGSHEDWSAWTSYTQSIQVDNWGADGTRWAGVQVRDVAGNVTEVWDSIILDTKAPSGVVRATKPRLADDNLVTIQQSNLLSVAGNDIKPLQNEVLDNGRTLHLWGNTWKALYLPYAITADTVLEFDFKSVSALGEVAGIGFSNSQDPNNIQIQGTYGFHLEGTQDWLDRKKYAYLGGDEWQHFVIPVGEHFTGSFNYLFFANDADAAQATDISFRNVKLYNLSQAVNSANVSLVLAGSDATSGIDAMRFSMDGGAAWSPWEAYTEIKSLTLPPGDGLKEVQYQLRDRAGLVSTFTDTLTVDTAAPVANVSINNNAAAANAAGITLSLSASDATSGIADMSFAINSTNESDYSAWESFAATKALTLPSTNGSYQVNVRIRDKAGNITTVSKSILLDTQPPVGSILINNGAVSTTSSFMTLSMTGSDSLSGLDQVRYSTNSGTTWTDWEGFTNFKTMTLPVDSGSVEVKYQLRDQAGNVSAYADSILYYPPIFELQAEKMQNTVGGPSENGNAWTLWGNGKVFDTRQVASGIYDIEIVAMGKDAAGVLALMQARIDNRSLGDPVSVANNNWSFSSYAFRGVELEEGAHEFAAAFLNDFSGGSWETDRNLYIDKIIIKKVGELPSSSERFSLKATQMQTEGGTWNGGTYVSLWGNAKVYQDYEVKESGIYQIEIAANGLEGSGELPFLRATVDNRVVGNPVQAGNNYWAYKTFVFQSIELEAGSHKFAAGILDGLSGQSLGIQQIVVRKIGELPPPTDRFSLKATQMQTEGGAWNGGTYMSVWGYGKVLQDYEVNKSGIYEIEVVASGVEGSGKLPFLRATVDNRQVGDPVEATNNSWAYKSYVFRSIELEAGIHNFSAGILGGLAGQSLGIQQIIVRKIGELPPLTERFSLKAVEMQAEGGNWNGGSYVSLWGSGRVLKDYDVKKSGIYEIEVVAQGTEGGGALPTLQVMIDSQAAGTPVIVTNNSWAYKSYIFQAVELQAGIHNFSAGILNGLANQSLGLQQIIVRKIADILPSQSAYTNARNITLNLLGLTNSNPVEMSFAVDSARGEDFSAWETFSPAKSLTLPDADKSHFVMVRVRNASGQISVFGDSILLDRSVPAGSVLINKGNAYATSHEVTLDLSAQDTGSGMGEMSFAVNSTSESAYSAWETYSPAKTLLLPVTNGTYFVSTRFKDRAGNITTVSDAIELDVTTPQGLMILNGGAEVTNSETVTANLNVTDTGSGILDMHYSVDNGGTWSQWVPYAPALPVTYGNLNEPLRVLVEVRDRAGNISTFQDTIQFHAAAGLGKTYNFFKESDGLAVIEAEHPVTLISRNGTSWQFQNTVTGFSDQGYFYAGPDTGKSQNTDYLVNSPELQYQVQIQSPGTYYVWVLGYAESSSSNSVHVGIDGVASATSDRIDFQDEDVFLWSKKTLDGPPPTVNITTAGLHTLNVWMREDGFRLDKILLTKDPNYIPIGFGPDESSRLGLTPTGSVIANNGREYGTGPAVDLSITAASERSQVQQMRFSYDRGQTWTSWENFSSAKTLAVEGTGLKEIQCEIQDASSYRAIFKDDIFIYSETSVPQSNSLFEFSRGNSWSVNFKEGIVESVQNTQGKLVNAAFDADGNLLAADFYAANGDRWEIRDGRLTKVIRVNGYVEYYDERWIVRQEDVAGKVQTFSRHPLSFQPNVFSEEESFGAYADFDGSSDSLTYPHDPAFEFGAENWTIDFRVWFDQSSAEYVLFKKGDHLTGGLQLNRHADIDRWDIITAGNTILSVTTNLTDDAWHHVAVVRDGGILKFFQDGILVGSTDIRNGGVVNNTETLTLGYLFGSSQFFPGRIDEFRVSRGIARWTSNFTPPALEYVPDSSTVLLDHYGASSVPLQITPYDPLYELDIQTQGTSYPVSGLLAEQYSSGSDDMEVGSDLNVTSVFQSVKFNQTVSLENVEFWLNRYQDPSGHVVAKVYETSGSSVGNLIGVSTPRDVTEFSRQTSASHSSGDWQKFEFETPVRLEANKTYWVSFSLVQPFQTLGSSANKMLIYRNGSASSYPNGQAAQMAGTAFQPLAGDLDFHINGYLGDTPLPGLDRYGVDAEGDLRDAYGRIITSLVGTRAKDQQITIPGGFLDLVESMRGVKSATVTRLSANQVNEKNYLLQFSVNGVTFEAQQNLKAGANALNYKTTDSVGAALNFSWDVFSNTFLPEVEFLSNPVSHTGVTQIEYQVDGELRQETVYLQAGLNKIVREFPNQWGVTQAEFEIDYQPVLEDGTVLKYRNGLLSVIEKQGMLFENIVLSSQGELVAGLFTGTDGKKMEIKNGQVFSITEPAGGTRLFENGYLLSDLSPSQAPLYYSRFWENQTAHSLNGYGEAISDKGAFGSYGYFDGSGDYLSVPAHADWNFGAADFTFETWFRPEEVTSSTDYILSLDRSDNNIHLRIKDSKFNFGGSTSGTSRWNIDGTTTVAANQWYHIAGVRTGNTFKLFVNGIQEGGDDTYTGSAATDPAIFIGLEDTGHSNYFKGWLDETRISKGIARWTSNFIPETQPYSSDPQTVFLHHFDSLNTAETGASHNLSNGVSVSGNTKLEGIKPKFGNFGAFDGTGDYLQLPESPDFILGQNNFTVDFWVSLDQEGQEFAILSNAYMKTGANGNYSLTMKAGQGTGQISLYTYDGQANSEQVFAGGLTLASNRWYHVALTRQGNQAQFYVDGQALTMGQNVINKSLGVFDSSPLIGRDRDHADLNGYLDEFRISTGARWLGAFSPQANPYSTDSNTRFLHHFENLAVAGRTTAFDPENYLKIQKGASASVPPPAILVQNQNPGNWSLREIGDDTAEKGRLQSVRFTDAKTVTNIDFWINRLNDPQGRVFVSLYKDSAGKPGERIGASAERDVQAFPRQTSSDFSLGQWQTFNFEKPVALNANQTYWISIEIEEGYPSWGDGANYITAYKDGGASYPDGIAGNWLTNGSVDTSSSYDLNFRVTGYEGAYPGPEISTYGIGPSGELLDSYRRQVTSPYAPYQEGYTVPTNPLIQSNKEGLNLAGLLDTARIYHLPGTPPTFQLLSEKFTNDNPYLLRYAVNGTIYERQETLLEGNNEIQVQASGALGQAQSTTFVIALDTAAPAVELHSPAQTNFSNYTLQYIVDGSLREEKIRLNPGVNPITKEIFDKAGNKTTAAFSIEYIPFFQNAQPVYDASNHLLSFTDPGLGITVEYSQQAPYAIFIKNQSGGVIEEIRGMKPKASFPDALAITLQDGIQVFYRNNELVAMRLVNGTELQNLTVDGEGNIEKADIFYADGQVDYVRYGQLLRSAERNGALKDYGFHGRIVREILQEGIHHFYYVFDQAGNIVETRRELPGSSVQIYNGEGTLVQINEASGAYTRLDGGILREIRDESGKRYFYDEGRVTMNGESFITSTLNTDLSDNPDLKAPLQAFYTVIGYLSKVKLIDATEINFRDGIVEDIIDAEGRKTTLEYLEDKGLLSGLLLKKGTAGSAQFEYDRDGLLSRITTSAGILEVDGDEIARIFLPDGAIIENFVQDPTTGDFVSGTIIGTDGAKRIFVDRKLVRVETAAGEIYENVHSETSIVSYLKELRFHDGTVAKYTNAELSRIEFGDGRILSGIILANNGYVQSATETLPGGEQLIYDNEKLTARILADGSRIDYENGLAKTLTNSEAKTYQFEYVRNASGDILSFRILGNQEVYSYLKDASGLFHLDSVRYQHLTAKMNAQGIEYLDSHFGKITSPTFDAEGSLSGGTLTRIDGAVIQIENGNVRQTTLVTGEKLFYGQDRLEAVETAFGRIELLYDQNHFYVRYSQNGETVTESMAVFLLRPEREIERNILLTEPLVNSLADKDNIKVRFDTGNDIHLVLDQADSERGEVFSFNTGYQPVWGNVYQDAIHQGYILDAQQLQDWDDLPAMNSDFVDINGDGLPDRILFDYNNPTYYTVQLNNGTGFDNPVQWNNVWYDLDEFFEGRSDELKYSADNPRNGTISFFEGRHPHKLSEFIDMNGDKLPDRVILGPLGESHWIVQFNNGENGFADPFVWEGAFPSARIWSYQAPYSLEIWNDEDNQYTQELMVDMMDMNGDGRPDRVIIAPREPYDYWFVQYNNGTEFEFPVVWKNVVNEFHFQDHDLDGALAVTSSHDYQSLVSTVADMNGDGKADRIFSQYKDRNNQSLGMDWYVQINNGDDGFEDPVLWDSDIRSIRDESNMDVAQSIRFMDSILNRQVFVELMDINGDGLKDRISLDRATTDSSSSFWWVELNNGSGFDDAVKWTGVESRGSETVGIRADQELWHSTISMDHGHITLQNELIDINKDGLPDRVMYEPGNSEWLIQFNNGHGFEPLRNMQIDALIVKTENMNPEDYDYLHISLKLERENVGESFTVLNGAQVKVGNLIFDIPQLSSEWNDYYLPLAGLAIAAGAAPQVEVIAAEDLTREVFVDNISWVKKRSVTSKDWMRDLLFSEFQIPRVKAISGQDLSHVLTRVEADSTSWPHLKEMLEARTVLKYTSQGEIFEIDTADGRVANVAQGKITEISNPDGSHVELNYDTNGNLSSGANFSDLNANPEYTTRFSYGRVREVENTEGDRISYAYEFDQAGNEISLIKDPETGNTYRYLGDRLIGVLRANGLEIVYEYDENGEIENSRTYYKGILKQSFGHEVLDGRDVIIQENGIREEYNAEGQIVFHTLPNGLRYQHEFVHPDKVTSTVTGTETIEGQTYEITSVTVTSDTSLPKIHRVRLIEQIKENGEAGYYDKGKLTSVLLQDGSRIFWENVLQGETLIEKVLMVYADGVEIEFENGKPAEVRASSGEKHTFTLTPTLSLEGRGQGEGADPLDFHYSEALKAWGFIQSKKQEFTLDTDTTVIGEFDLENRPITQWLASGAASIYNDKGQLVQVLDENGNIQAQYEYDAEGNPTKVTLVHYRQYLPQELARIRAAIERERAEALRLVGERDFILTETAEGNYEANYERLLKLRQKIEAQRSEVASIQLPSRGKAAKDYISGILGDLDSQIAQINAQMEAMAKSLSDFYRSKAGSIEEANTQIQAEYDAANQKVIQIKADNEKEILVQELTPIIIHYYRLYLGRDPSNNEIAGIVQAQQFNVPFNLNGFKTSLSASQERADRITEVSAVKSAVQSLMEAYVNGNAVQKAAILQGLSLNSNEVVDLTPAEVETILNWLQGFTVNLAQSAFLALEALLDEASISHSRVDLARDLIVMDILKGVLTPLEEGELLISLFSLRHYAQTRGLHLYSLQMDYNDLLVLYNEQCEGQGEDCEISVVAHVGQNHYVIVKKVTSQGVVFENPRHGPEDQLEQVSLSAEEFQKIWEGVTLTARAPPNSQTVQTLSEQDELDLRGAWFGIDDLIIAIIIIIIITVVVSIVVDFAVNLIATGSIKEAFKRTFDYIKAIATGDFFYAARVFDDHVFDALERLAGFLGKIIPFLGKFALKVVKFAREVNDWVYEKIIDTPVFRTIFDAVKIVAAVAITVATFGAATPISLAAIATSTATFASGYLLSSGISGILSRYTDLSPAAINLISAGSSFLLNFGMAGFAAPGVGFNLDASLSFLGSPLGKSVLTDFAVAGAVGLGDILGLDPRLTGFLNIGARAIAGGVSNYFKPNSTLSESSGILNNAKGAIQLSPTAIGLNLESAGTGIFIPAAQILNEAVSQPGLLSRIFSSFKDSAVSAINFLGPAAFAAIPDILASFNQKQINDGLSQTLNKNAAMIFDRPTIENIFNTQGGIDAILAQGATPITLPDGTAAKGYRFSDTTTLIFDNNNNFLGQLKNGRYELGDFSITGTGEFVLKDGVVVEDIGNGQTLKTEIQAGKIINITVEEGAGNPVVIIEGNAAPIIIEGPDGDQQLGNGIVNLVKQGLKFILKNGSIIQMTAKLLDKPMGAVEVPAQTGDPVDVKERRTYLLNGIGNVNPGESGAPEYMVNLRDILRDVYGFTNTALIGLYQGFDFSPITNTLSGFETWIKEFIVGFDFETIKVISKIASDLAVGIIKAGDTINVIAYSGGGQRIIEASWFLPVKIDLIAYGAPMLASTISDRIQTIQPVWGTKDILSALGIFPIGTGLTFASYMGSLKETIWMDNVWHFDQPNLDKWGYHCDGIHECNHNGESFLEWLARLINGFFVSLVDAG